MHTHPTVIHIAVDCDDTTSLTDGLNEAHWPTVTDKLSGHTETPSANPLLDAGRYDTGWRYMTAPGHVDIWIHTADRTVEKATCAFLDATGLDVSWTASSCDTPDGAAQVVLAAVDQQLGPWVRAASHAADDLHGISRYADALTGRLYDLGMPARAVCDLITKHTGRHRNGHSDALRSAVLRTVPPLTGKARTRACAAVTKADPTLSKRAVATAIDTRAADVLSDVALTVLHGYWKTAPQSPHDRWAPDSSAALAEAVLALLHAGGAGSKFSTAPCVDEARTTAFQWLAWEQDRTTSASLDTGNWTLRTYARGHPGPENRTTETALTVRPQENDPLTIAGKILAALVG